MFEGNDGEGNGHEEITMYVDFVHGYDSMQMVFKDVCVCVCVCVQVSRNRQRLSSSLNRTVKSFLNGLVRFRPELP